MRIMLKVTAVLAALVVLTGRAPALAQQGGEGSYTTAQADAGAVTYSERCAVCHLDTLQGSFEAPELAGPNFRNTWGARPVADLLNQIASTMPPQDIGSLAIEEVADVVAYVLRQTGCRAAAPSSS